MLTTLTLDDRLAKLLRKKAYETDSSFKKVVNRTLRDGIEVSRAIPKGKPYKVTAVQTLEAAS